MEDTMQQITDAMDTGLDPLTTVSGDRPRRRRNDWQKHAEEIKRLYIEQNKSLVEVKAHMEKEHGFPRMNVRAYEKAFKRLHISKNVPNETMRYIVDSLSKRESMGKATEVYWHGKMIDKRRLRRARQELKNQKYDTIAPTVAVGASAKENVCLATPAVTDHGETPVPVDPDPGDELRRPKYLPQCLDECRTALTTLLTTHRQTNKNDVINLLQMSFDLLQEHTIEPLISQADDYETIINYITSIMLEGQANREALVGELCQIMMHSSSNHCQVMAMLSVITLYSVGVNPPWPNRIELWKHFFDKISCATSVRDDGKMDVLDIYICVVVIWPDFHEISWDYFRNDLIKLVNSEPYIEPKYVEPEFRVISGLYVYSNYNVYVGTNDQRLMKILDRYLEAFEERYTYVGSWQLWLDGTIKLCSESKSSISFIVCCKLGEAMMKPPSSPYFSYMDLQGLDMSRLDLGRLDEMENHILEKAKRIGGFIDNAEALGNFLDALSEHHRKTDRHMLSGNFDCLMTLLDMNLGRSLPSYVDYHLYLDLWLRIAGTCISSAPLNDTSIDIHHFTKLFWQRLDFMRVGPHRLTWSFKKRLWTILGDLQRVVGEEATDLGWGRIAECIRDILSIPGVMFLEEASDLRRTWGLRPSDRASVSPPPV